MEAVMLIAEKPDLLPVFKQIIESVFPASFVSDLGNNQPGFVIELSSRSRIYIEFYGSDLKSIGWEDFEIGLITKRFNQNHYVYSIAYHSIEAVKKVIVSLANSDQVMIDNDGGDLIVGSEMVDRILNEPTCDWLKDFWAEDE